MLNTTKKCISLKIGIYNTEAVITPHNNGDVTISHPFLKGIDHSTDTLGFYDIELSGNLADIAKKVFSDEPYMVKNQWGDIYDLPYLEFIDDNLLG